ARLVNQGQTLEESYVARAIEISACEVEEMLADSVKLPQAAARKYLAETSMVKPLASFADKIDRFERFVRLDLVCRMAERGFDSLLDAVGRGERSGWSYYLTCLLVDWFADWNEVLRNVNDWFDQSVKAGEQPGTVKRLAAYAALEGDFNNVRS